jgi:L-aspartate oxidase
MSELKYDFLVIGSGAAGLTSALNASDHGSVLLICKQELVHSNSSWAQGGIAAVMGKSDDFEQHVKDTLIAGVGLCNEEAVRSIIQDGPEAMKVLEQLGVKFDRKENGDFDLTREGGHEQRRILHVADATGKALTETLIERVKEKSSITVLEHHFAIDLITTTKLGMVSEDRVLGAYVLDEKTRMVKTVRANRVILATGGCGRVYLYTTNPNVATGDGVAMAWRAGVSVANMEFLQFHPTCLYHPQKRSFLITEAMRGEGARLVDKRGQEFMQRYDKRGSLAPRDVVARAIDHEIKRTGSPCVYLDISHRDPEFIAQHFPNIMRECAEVGIDITKKPIPVVPAAHYQCGGVLTDHHGATRLRGLCAVGEVACTGLHGANRLASNSLLECVVMAKRAVEYLTHKLPISREIEENVYEIPQWQSSAEAEHDELVVIYHNWDEIRKLMWDYVSIVRTDKRLLRAAARLRNLKREVMEFYWNYHITAEILELRNLVEVASLIVDCALRRRESRGLHYSLDCPEFEDNKVGVDTMLRRF